MKRHIAVYIFIIAVLVFAGYQIFTKISETNIAEKTKANITVATPLYETFILSNGMRVFVVPNHTIPAVSHMVWYRVGAKDELRGESGITHLLEHLLFKGTEKFPKGVFSDAVSESGGQENAFTGQDYTAFYQNVPLEKLGLMMEMEADRMKNLSFNDAEFETERDVVMEEYRMRMANNPRALMLQELDASLFRNHPYRKQVIGWEHEIRALKPKDALSYYHKYYDPKNAILVVSGDVDSQTVKDLAEENYGKIFSNFVDTREEVVEPPRVASSKIIYKDEKVAQAEYWQKFIAPSYTAKNPADVKKSFALEVLARMLGGGTSSILYRKLVVEKGVAAAAGSAYNGYNVGPSEFTIFAYPQGIAPEKLQEIIAVEIAKIQNGKVDAERLAAVKKSMIAEQIYEREGLQQMAYNIAQNYIIGLSPEFFGEWEKGIDAVTAEDIALAAQDVLQQDKSALGLLLPKKSEEK